MRKLIPLTKPYVISSICKQDLINVGFNEKTVNSLDDFDMGYLVEKLEAVYTERAFWVDLKTIVEHILELKKEIK